MGKHIINSVESAVGDSLRGAALLNPLAIFDPHNSILSLRTLSPRVHLLSGGGSGHGNAAYVGEGLLSAAVAGNIFASPSAKQVESALKRLSNEHGTLVVVMNYTGDVLNFGLAKSRFESAKSPSRIVIVADDVSIPRSQGALTGRRGLAATVLVYKLAGALAQQGANLDEVEYIANAVNKACGTIGVGLDHATVPGQKNADRLEEDEIEIGMGIHNEPGFVKKTLPTAAALVDELLTKLTATDDAERSYLDFKHDGKDSVVLLVNNLGGLGEIEMGVVVKEAGEWLAKKNITVERALASPFLTALDLPGFSITLLLLPRDPLPHPTSFSAPSKLSFDTQLFLDCFDAPTDSSAWPRTNPGRPCANIVENAETAKAIVVDYPAGPTPTDPKLLLSCLDAACESLLTAEPDITRYDTIGGDGDAGQTLSSGATAILAKLSSNEISSKDCSRGMRDVANCIEEAMGGTSGGLYAIFFHSLAKSLGDAGEVEADLGVWSRALELALNNLYEYTLARPPSRTLIDPLSTFILTLSLSPSPTSLHDAFVSAKEAALATIDLEAKVGRAAYVDAESLREAKVPDAGAWGVWCILEAVQKKLEGN